MVRSPPLGGMGYVGTYLALLTALSLLFYLTGHAATRRLLGPLAPAAAGELWAHRLVAGVALWGLGLFVLATLQRLRPAPVAASIAAAAAWGVWSVRRRRLECSAGEAATRRDAPARRSRRLDRWALPLVATLAVVAVALWAQALRPIVAWDADVYHLTVPRLYLEHGGFRRIPFNVYSNWPLAVELLFALAMVVKDYVLATTLHLGFGIALAALVAAAVARVATPLWGAIAAGLLLLHPVVLYEIRVAYVDLACAFFLLAALLAVDRALDQPAAETRWLAVAGIAAGALAAAKLNGVLGAATVAVVWAGSRLLSGASPRSLWGPLLAFAAPVATLWLPWVAKSWWLTGNPVYPLLYGLFGGPEWSAALGASHRAWQRSIGMGRAPLDYLLLPLRVLFQGGLGYAHFDGRLHPASGVLLPLALLGAVRAPLARRSLAAAAIWFALWAATSQQMRLLIPALPLLAIATAAGGHALAQRLLPRPVLAARALAILLVPLLVQANALYLRQAPRLLAALWSRGDQLRAHATDEVFAVIEQRVPPGAKILFVNVNRAFFCRREVIADSFFEASQVAAMLHGLGDRDAIRRGLGERGVTHVLVERQEHGPVYPAGFVELLEDPANRVVYRSQDGRFTLYALAPVAKRG